MAPSALLPDPEPEYIIVHAGKGTIKREILKGDKKKPTFETITQVDFSKMNSSSLEDRKAIAKEIGAAFRDSGFLYAANHGIDEKLQDDLLAVIKEFFDLPFEKKMKIHVNKSDTIKGYEALLETKLDACTRGDLKEAFATGDDPNDPEQNPPATLNRSLYPSNGNQWPASPPTFRKTMYAYQAAILSFSKSLMQLIALSLSLPETYFDHMSSFPMGGLRALHYPPQDVSTDVGIGAHADYSWFTLVNQLSATPALEVLNHNGAWVSAPPVKGTLVVNVGDFLEMATRGRYVSTVHRVVNMTGMERYSLAWFFSPSAECVVETVPGCEVEGEEGVRVVAGEWQRERLLRARYKHPSSVAARARGEL
ncbi:Clavaminate synthase-like protein [Mollisia scopiformis]|uniref:Clavaminate synthase-like protein n=1 Tax=Mollisia scopiformis TaxID=149040 RepID=A0A194WYJ1_MOLSC|nr:Clavaminate synthase-like protein [Mollisia scopiformis]KUJ13015.1 Clavaminate synthase-like protein [Mollisia scopiformis]